MMAAFELPPHIAHGGLSKRYNATLENHIRCLGQPKVTTMMSRSRELPMPNVSKFSSLSQAHAILLHCWTRLSRLSYENPSPSTPSTASQELSPSSSQTSPISDEKRQFQRWLEQWEVAFTLYLTDSMPSMTSEDLTESRVLKANHLACTILAFDGIPCRVDDPDADQRAILELADAVLRLRYLAESPRQATSHSSPSTAPQLDVKEPLHVVVSRCSEESTRIRAFELLSRYYPQSPS